MGPLMKLKKKTLVCLCDVTFGPLKNSKSWCIIYSTVKLFCELWIFIYEIIILRSLDSVHYATMFICSLRSQLNLKTAFINDVLKVLGT